MSVKWPFFQGVPLTWRESIVLTYYFAIIIYSPNTTFVPSLSEIGDLSCITSSLLISQIRSENFRIEDIVLVFLF